jgi:long-chain acyl-CoA synthetase
MDRIWLDRYPDGIPTEIDADRYASVVAVLEHSCARFADRPAFHNLGHTLTYRDLDRLSGAMGACLNSLGLVRGDRVALMMPNLLQYPVALFGVLRAGLVAVNVNPLYTPRELQHQLEDCGARAIVIVANCAHVLERVIAKTAVTHVIVTEIGDLAGFPKKQLVNFAVRHVRRMVPPYRLPGAIRFSDALEAGAGSRPAAVEVRGDDLAFLQYTGGTTGVAKGTMLTHRNMVANLEQISAWFSQLVEDGREIIITPLPLYHIISLTVNCLAFMKHGGLNVLITNPRDLLSVVRELARWRFTAISGVNTLYNALLGHERFAALDFSALKVAVAGGMALHHSVAQRWLAVTGRPLVEGYGLSEAAPVVCCNPLDAPRIGTIGLPLPSTDIAIREDGVDVAPGESGELWVRGPQVMRGYWNMPDETAATLTPDGWLRTGDIAQIDEQGFVKIVDRRKDLIIVSGFKVFPNEIEDVIAAHESVSEVGCVGVTDERTGQAVKVFVVVKSGTTVTPESIREYCRTSLTAYKIPKYVEFRDDLPKTNVGKILRRALLDEPSVIAMRGAAAAPPDTRPASM